MFTRSSIEDIYRTEDIIEPLEYHFHVEDLFSQVTYN